MKSEHHPNIWESTSNEIVMSKATMEQENWDPLEKMEVILRQPL